MQEEVLYKITNGLYVISARHKDKPETFAGSLVDAVSQITINPNLIIVSCMNSSYTAECIEQFGEFGVSILPRDINPLTLGIFGFQTSRNVNKWENVRFAEQDGLPYLSEAIGKIRGKVVHKIKYPCNTLFIAGVEDAFAARDAEPLTYQHYRAGFKNKVMEAFSLWQKDGLSPTLTNDLAQEAAAPAPLTPQTQEKRWTCIVCGYVYDGEIPFEELPDDWLCPLCSVGKEFFELR